MSKAIAVLADRPVAYHPILAKCVGGVKPALLLSQLMYWMPRGRNNDGWIYKSADELYEELGMTRREQETARRILIEKGILEYKVRSMPATGHYRINIEALESVLPDGAIQFLQKRQTGFDKSAKPVSTEAPNYIKESETTSEITAETTSGNGADEPRPSTRPRDLHFENLADLCGMTPPERNWKRLTKTAAGQLNKYAKELRGVGATPDQIAAFEEWWRENDWRGQKGQLPTPADVVKCWPLFQNGMGRAKSRGEHPGIVAMQMVMEERNGSG